MPILQLSQRLLLISMRLCAFTGSPITGINRTAHFVPDDENLERFGRATSWVFISVMILSGATYLFAGLRDEHTLPRGSLAVDPVSGVTHKGPVMSGGS
jgi:hypothetical protein